MKLIIQIPCYNEELTLAKVIDELPSKIDGVSSIEYQVIDDGSNDKTAKIAKKLGVHHIIQFKKNRGLGTAFKYGLTNALHEGADILVNTDGDNQYPGKDIISLVRPIILGQAEIVIGDRKPTKTPHFSRLKRFLQWLGNRTVSYIAGEKIPDAVSGFRAYSREAMYEINVTSRFSYVLDTLIQAYKKGLKVQWISTKSNPPTRPSRLFSNILEHIKKSTVNILRIYTMYEPLKVFLVLSIPSLLLGSVGILRFLYFAIFTSHAQGMIQSLIISAILMTIGITLFALGILGDVLAKNRMLVEQQLSLLKRNELRHKDGK